MGERGTTAIKTSWVESPIISLPLFLLRGASPSNGSRRRSTRPEVVQPPPGLRSRPPAPASQAEKKRQTPEQATKNRQKIWSTLHASGGPLPRGTRRPSRIVRGLKRYPRKGTRNPSLQVRSYHRAYWTSKADPRLGHETSAALPLPHPSALNAEGLALSHRHENNSFDPAKNKIDVHKIDPTLLAIAPGTPSRSHYHKGNAHHGTGAPGAREGHQDQEGRRGQGHHPWRDADVTRGPDRKEGLRMKITHKGKKEPDRREPDTRRQNSGRGSHGAETRSPPKRFPLARRLASAIGPRRPPPPGQGLPPKAEPPLPLQGTRLGTIVPLVRPPRRLEGGSEPLTSW